MTSHRELGLLVAMALGVGFGFVLERAGFGTAKKLTGQFYLHDMTVFKVMFSAIVTAMLGLVVLGGVGVVDLNGVLTTAASPTFLYPMLVGGVVLGVGFILSGYCPGTSLVASASGKIDGLYTIAGVVLGSVAYGFVYPLVAGYTTSGDLGQRFLDQITGIPRPVLAMAIALMAVGMFMGAEKVEVIFRRKRKLDGDLEGNSEGNSEEVPFGELGLAGKPGASGKSAAPMASKHRRYVFAGMGVSAVLAVATLALPGAPRAAVTQTRPQARPLSAVKAISPAELARRLVSAPWKLRIVDLRDKQTCEEKSIPGAECVPAGTLGKHNLDVASPARDLVLVDASTAVAPRAARVYRGDIFKLDGGFTGWKAYALTAPEPPDSDAEDSTWEAYRFRAAFHQAMTGRKTAPAVKAPAGFVPKRRKKRRGGCS
jgi:hypothetical protein